MSNPLRIVARIALCLACASVLTVAPAHAQEPPDAPESGARREAPSRSDAPASYTAALAAWKSPEEIARFVGATFVYDRARALALAEAPASRAPRPAIHSPEAMFESPEGVCIDLARFGVETLNRVDSSFAAQYLMLEFEPVVIEGRTLRRHWVASFRRDGKLWFFADSRRPGHVAGPYDSVAAFVAEYSHYRARPIVAWRETETFLRRTRAVARSGASG